MGGIIRCIRNDYNLDQIENEINRTDSVVIEYDDMMRSIKQKNNIYIDDDKVKGEYDHYSDNSLIKGKPQKNKSMYIPSSITLK